MKNSTLFGALALSLTAFTAPGAVIISNLPFGNPGIVSNAFAVNLNVAAGFSMPAGPNYSLDSVTLELTLFSSFSGVTVSLYGGDSSAPSGAALAVLSNPSLPAPGTHQPYTFTPAGALTLNASSNYWIVLDGAGSSSSSVEWSAGSAAPPTGLGTFLGQRQAAALPPTTPMTLGNNLIAAFEVNGTSQATNGQVPEPGTITLLGAGFAALAFLRRR